MIIYWSAHSSVDELFLALRQPEPSMVDIKSIRPQSSIGNRHADFTLCPSIIDYSRNLYSLKSPLNLNFWSEEHDIMFDNFYSDDFFRKIINVRDGPGGIVSLNVVPYIFFAEESCIMQYSGPSMTNNSFVDHCSVVPGQVDIGRWFRSTDLATVIRKKNQKVIVNKGDTVANVRFCTSEKITFKKFYFNQQLDEYSKKVTNYKHSQNNSRLRDYFANMYTDFEQSRLRELILKEIKKNLMD